jgi:cytochrome c peroxidase
MIRTRIAHWPGSTPLLLLTLVVGSASCSVDSAADLDVEESKDDDESDSERRRIDPDKVRALIDEQVGGIEKLMVPPDDESIPLPRNPDGSDNPRFATTEEKRFLGKMLFHDPIRTARIDPAFGGVVETGQTASCGSCHLGEAIGKAGTQLNFAVGGEGRGYTDEDGNFIVRRRARTDILPRLRDEPLFEGDALVDHLPTLTDVYQISDGVIEVATPARGTKEPLPEALLETGRLDALDSVGRQSPAMIGMAFNNRLLLGGFAGESNDSPGGLNPFGDPALENLTLLLLDAHRMLEAQAAVLQGIPAFVRLFEQAFPEEAAMAEKAGDPNLLINDETVLRATATFLRTAVTRNTPFDRFLAGDDRALTKRQLRGAKLFFTPAPKGGAGCFTCHSGPMLSKQHDDPDVAGIGEFVEENFINVGIGDHPIQELNRLVRDDPNFHDTGREEITMNEEDVFEFRVVGLRQLRDARTFFHNGSITTVEEAVRYFNDGVPQDPAAAAAPTLSPRFTHPRGEGSEPGLGLSENDIEALTDFLENGLYDPAFAEFDPDSTTETFQPNERDLIYSVHRPDLAELGAIDGFMISGLPIDNNDPLSRRDAGLEFLDVTERLDVELVDSGSRSGRGQTDVYKITNNSDSIVDTHLLMIAQGLPDDVKLDNGSGETSAGDPYRRLFLEDGVLLPGQSIVRKLRFERRRGDARSRGEPISYTLVFLSGQGDP